MPKIYVRTKTNVRTRRSYREVVDGQQRLIAIKEFANDEFPLGSNKEIYKEFAGKYYTDLDEDDQETFLSYALTVEQMFNATDDEVLDTFQRLNAYGLDLNKQELRHGKYHGAFRNAVIGASKRWKVLWEDYRVVGLRARVRMADDEVMAQLLGILLEGVQDGGQPTIERLYRKYDSGFPKSAITNLNDTLKCIVENFEQILHTQLAGSPHFVMLFAAVAHARYGIPAGDMKDGIPERDPNVLTDIAIASANLGVLADVLVQDIENVLDRFKAFKYASAGTTQRIRSRKDRFPILYKALLPHPV